MEEDAEEALEPLELPLWWLYWLTLTWVLPRSLRPLPLGAWPFHKKLLLWLGVD